MPAPAEHLFSPGKVACDGCQTRAASCQRAFDGAVTLHPAYHDWKHGCTSLRTMLYFVCTREPDKSLQRGMFGP